MNSAREPEPSEGPRRAASAAGFTLVEIMVATVLLSMIILGILAVLIGSYRVAAKARYNDHARYVIKSFADQFLTQQTTDANGNVLPLFMPTSATGYGLSWTNSDGSVSSGGTVQASAPASIPVLLGDNTGAPLTAQVSRTVWYLYTTGGSGTLGTNTSIPQSGSAGYILRADFTISYNFLGGAIPPITITANRSVP
jgi:prepilin-type N-terminal cleavage/methylation domain-containing protein